MSFSTENKPWGEVPEKSLSSTEMMTLMELCHGASEGRVDYLVRLYNERSSSLQRVEAHFVARYAARRGYTQTTDDKGRTIFSKT